MTYGKRCIGYNRTGSSRLVQPRPCPLCGMMLQIHPDKQTRMSARLITEISGFVCCCPCELMVTASFKLAAADAVLQPSCRWHAAHRVQPLAPPHLAQHNCRQRPHAAVDCRNRYGCCSLAQRDSATGSSSRTQLAPDTPDEGSGTSSAAGRPFTPHPPGHSACAAARGPCGSPAPPGTSCTAAAQTRSRGCGAASSSRRWCTSPAASWA